MGQSGTGCTATAQVVIEPRMPPAEREANREQMSRAADARARLAAEIPEDVLLAMARALRAAHQAGREGRPL